MKLTRIQTENFLGARSIDVRLAHPVTLFAGANGSGKSSTQEAIRQALAGESVRVSLKKDLKRLISDGAEVGYAVVEFEGGQGAFTLPNGAHEISAPMHPALPFVLDAQRFTRLTADERRSFLFGLTGLRCDLETVAPRLEKRNCEAGKVEQIGTYLRAGFDAAHKEAASRARDAKSAWRTVTGETYGEKKAEGWKAETADSAALKDEQAARVSELSGIEAALETATQDFGALRTRQAATAGRTAKLVDLTERAGRYARIQDKLLRDESELKEWEAKVEATRQRASGGRKTGLVHDLAGSLNDCLSMVIPFGDMNAIQRKSFSAANGALERYTEEHGVAGGKQDAGDADAVARLPEYEKALALMLSAVANGRRDLAAADAAAIALKQLEEDNPEAPGEEALMQAQSRVEDLKNRREGVQTNLEGIRAALRKADEAATKTQAAARHHAEVLAWIAIADALAPDGIPGELLSEALDPINALLEHNAGLSGWYLVAIGSDMAITYGGRDYALISESEKWRVDAMIAEAVSHLSGVRLLVLDRFDVLDMAGREDLLYWLDTMAADRVIDSALIFGTLKALPANLPENCWAVWIENGVAGQIKEAA